MMDMRLEEKNQMALASEAPDGDEGDELFDEFLRFVTSGGDGDPELGVRRHATKPKWQQEKQEEPDEGERADGGSDHETDASSSERPGTGELAPCIQAQQQHQSETPPKRRPGRRRSSLSKSFSGGVDLMAIAPRELTPEDLMPEDQENDFEAALAAAALRPRPKFRPANRRSSADDANAPDKPKGRPRGRRATFSRSFSASSITANAHEENKSSQEEKSSDSETESDLTASPKPRARRPGRRRASLTESFSSKRASLTRSISGLGFSPGSVLGDDPATPADKKAFGVHFSVEEDEVHLVRFDWNHADDVFYTVSELQRMSQSRFDDAAALRKQRREEYRRRGSETLEDLELSTEATDVSALLTKALLDDDYDESTSIQGIEHFVYPDLQRAMIRKKKEAREEILNFVKSKKPDPQGWRLARRSQELTRWAQDVAQEKGMVYRMKRIHAEREGGRHEEEEEEEKSLGLGDVDLPTDEEWRRIEQMSSMPRRNLRGSSLF